VREAVREAADADLSEVSELAGHLTLDDHPDADALAVQDAGRQHGFDRVPDRVAKVDKVAQPGHLVLVIGHDVHFDRDRAHDDREEQLLRCGARRLRTSRVVHTALADELELAQSSLKTFTRNHLHGPTMRTHCPCR